MAVLNDIFAAAFDELRRNHGIKTQKELARRMGVSEDTITRIMKGRTDVTEDIITKLQTASGCIFNLQWLRGKDPYHMLAADLNAIDPIPDIFQSRAAEHPQHTYAPIPQWANSLIDILTKQIKENEALNRELRSTINEVNTLSVDLQKLIKNLKKS